MSTDDDFTAYVGTHWSGLVRCALLLGCPTHEAEGLVQDALVRVYPRWTRLWQDDRVDVEVHVALLDAVHGRADRTWRGEQPSDDGTHAPVPSEATTSDLTRVLDRLPMTDRDAIVLRYVAELSDEQTAEVLAIDPDSARERVARALAAAEPAWRHEESS